MVDCKILSYMKNNKKLILIVNKKFEIFDFENGTIHHATVDLAVWCNPLIFLIH